MKYLVVTIIAVLSFLWCIAGCGKHNAGSWSYSSNDTTGKQMKITVGTKVFTAALFNNATANAFKSMLPLTINMRELNGNEKFYYFPTTFPAGASAGGNIQTGDLMLYGNNCLVIFYESLNTSYSYTKIGRINNSSGLAAALGDGNANVRFELP